MSVKAFGADFPRTSVLAVLLLFWSSGLAFSQARPKIDAITAVDVVASTIGSGQPDIAQGGWAQMFGEGLADDGNNTTISVNGAATLSLVLSSSRVFFRVPPETGLGPAQFMVTVSGESDTFQFPVSAFAPTALRDGEIFHSDMSAVTAANPLRPGDIFIANGITGLGVSQPPPLVLLAGGQQMPITSIADNVAFGLVPALPGVYVLEGTVPNLTPGCYPVTYEVGGASWTSGDPENLAPIGAAGGTETVSCSPGPGGGPQFTSESLLGAAAFGPAARGGLASLFVGISDFIGDLQDSSFEIPLPETLAETTVEFTPVAALGKEKAQGATVAAPLVFVSGLANQINLQIPWEVPPGQTSVVVTSGGVASDPVILEIAEYAPGIFTFDFGLGRAVAFFNDGTIVHSEGTLGLPARPAGIGEAFSLLATGLGPTTPAAITGDDSSDGETYVQRDTVLTPTVTIGGVVAEVSASILSPQFVGVYQVVVIPQEGTPTGDEVPIVIDIGGETSRDDVTVAIGPKWVPIMFENYATFEAVGISGSTIHFQSVYDDGPFPWHPSSGAGVLPGYDASVTSKFDIIVTSLPVFDPVNMVINVTADFEQQIEAHAPDGSVTGTMTLTGQGEETFDVNPETVIVDEASGVIMRSFGSPLRDGKPVVTATLRKTTGIFKDIRAAGEWDLFVLAHQIIPIVPGLSLLENLSVTPIATFGEAVTVGAYLSQERGSNGSTSGLTAMGEFGGNSGAFGGQSP